ncbi:bifunctional diguanylate cyclase/phosphodiesterase [Magnetospirillum sp. UT-4]|uniref:putative bifunctional diguanylate cyclase/phosphodiesterase n=1 Tax=Magnetospirillum sp. UT-4 TaxID=2681467 RepID=UPI0015723115|nr:EAL domain-containing protein [Magnetospirillum sp. UT-4]
MRARGRVRPDWPDAGDRFRRLFDHSPDPAWIIAGNRFIDCNAAAVAMLGYGDKRGLLETHPGDLSPAFQPDGEDSRTKAERMIATARRNGQHRFEWVHTRADGSCFDAEVTLSSLSLDGREVIYCAWRDITTRKRDEERLQLARTVFDNSSEGIVVTDADALILSVNPAFTEITGYSADEAVGRKPSILRSDHHEPGFYADLWRTLLETGHWQGEVWNRRKDGSVYVQWQTITAVRDATGRVASYVSVFTDITNMRRNEDRIRHLAYHDALTGLPNRTLLMDRLEHGIAVARREAHRLAVLFLDLDRFKAVNDSLGHDAGDRLLREVAARIVASLRRTDTVARMGGDEFVVLLEPAGPADDIARTAEAVIAALDQPVDLGVESVRVTTSVGIAVFPETAEDAVSLLKQADTAMYAAKKGGRNTYRFFAAGMTEKTLATLRLERDLRAAIQRGEFELHYQPKICFEDRRPCGAEALVRWRRDGNDTLMYPADFIPLAEETGLVVALGDWVIEEACRQIAAWRAAGLGDIPLAVNVSARQLFSRDFAVRVIEATRRHGITPAMLQIEITESAVMADPDAASAILSELRALGATVAIDDFGTGYSSLAYLTRLPVDVIKIDRSFVIGLAEGVENAEIVASIVALGRALGKIVVAEGVENDEEVRLLTAAECPIGQGYLFARPMPAAELTPWLAGRKDCRTCADYDVRGCGGMRP